MKWNVCPGLSQFFKWLLLHIDIFPQESVVSQELVQTKDEGLVELVEDFDGLWQHGAHLVVVLAHVDRPVDYDVLHVSQA